MKISIITIFAVFAVLVMSVSAEECIWHKSLDLKGNGIMQTRFFQIIGKRWRIRYRSAQPAPFAVDLCDARGTRITTLASQRELRTMMSRSGTFSTDAVKGDVFLRVSGDDNGWALSFEQYVDTADDFKLTMADKRTPEMLPIGIWCGEKGEKMSIPLKIAAACWCLKLRTFTTGRLKVNVTDAAGACHLRYFILTPGESIAWFYKEGDYTFEAESIDTSWTVTLEIK